MDNQWISVDDRMPDDGVPVLVYYGNDRDKVVPAIEIDCAHTGLVDYCDGTEERLESNWTYKGYRSESVKPTHWMPFPEPPTP